MTNIYYRRNFLPTKFFTDGFFAVSSAADTPGTSSSNETLPTLGLTNEVKALVQKSFENAQEVMLSAAHEVAKRVANDFLEMQNKDQQRSLKIIERKASFDKVKISGKGNENQFNHAKEVMADLDEAIDHLEEEDYAKVRESLEQGKKKLTRRIKLIRIADRNGWPTVEEYLSDDLASDSDDEKQLNKAIRTANLKQEKRKRERKSFNQKRFEAKSRFSSQNNRITNFERIPAQPQRQPLNTQYRSNYNNNSSNRQCWNCFAYGHFYQQCPSLRDNNAKTVPTTVNK